MSEVAEHFRATIRAKADGESRGLLGLAADGVLAGELRRTLHLTDRAVRQWAAQAAARQRPGRESTYARLDPLRPETGHALQVAALEEQRAGVDAERELIAQMVWGIGERLAGIDPDAPPLRSQPALNQMAVEAGEILLATGRVLADPSWVVEQANEALRELVAVR
jgi:hypothetical protein